MSKTKLLLYDTTLIWWLIVKKTGVVDYQFAPYTVDLYWLPSPCQTSGALKAGNWL